MNEIMIDSVNLVQVLYALENFPITGITSNPTILKKEGDIDAIEHLKTIKSLKPENCSLHIQVVSTQTDDIIKEAKYIAEIFGKDIYIKIPANVEGISAIKQLSKEGFNITATAVYSSYQGIMSALAGAKYIAVYYNRMEINKIDPNKVIKEIKTFIDNAKLDAKILGASFKRTEQIMNAFTSGCQSVTVSFDLLKEGLSLPIIEDAIKKFKEDFEEIHGLNSTMISK